MIGAVAAAARQKRGTLPVNVGKDRQKAYDEQEKFWKNVDEQAKLSKLLHKYDTGKKGALGVKELGDMLQDLNKGSRPTDEEILWVLRVADSKNHDLDDMISVDELKDAIDTWVGYHKNAPLIKDVFKRYDTNRSGKLEHDQLKALLTELNDGIHPTEEEIHLIMSKADGQVVEATGGINPTELMFAISTWYTHTEECKRGCINKNKCVVM